MSLREGDPVAYALSHAREREAERIAELCGVPLGKVRSWRKGSLSLAPWVIAEIATVLKLDDTVLKQHHERRRRRQDADVKAQRELDEQAA
jgi:hypothetical protein